MYKPKTMLYETAAAEYTVQCTDCVFNVKLVRLILIGTEIITLLSHKSQLCAFDKYTVQCKYCVHNIKLVRASNY